MPIAVSSKSKRLSGLTKLRLSSHFLFLGGYELKNLHIFYDLFFCFFILDIFCVQYCTHCAVSNTVHSNGTASFLLGAKVPCIRLRSRSIPILWQSAVLVLHTRFLFFLQGTTSSCQQDPCLGSGLFTGHTQKTIQIAPGDLMGFWVEDHQATAHAFLFVRNLE